eukprot:1019396-Rhodomonas_salina.1
MAKIYGPSQSEIMRIAGLAEPRVKETGGFDHKVTCRCFCLITCLLWYGMCKLCAMERPGTVLTSPSTGLSRASYALPCHDL